MKGRQMLYKIGEGFFCVFLGLEPKAKTHGLQCGCSPADPHSLLHEAKKLSIARGDVHHETNLK